MNLTQSHKKNKKIKVKILEKIYNNYKLLIFKNYCNIENMKEVTSNISIFIINYTRKYGIYRRYLFGGYWM